MYQFFVNPQQIGSTNVCIEGNDVNHIKNVLRMKLGEEIIVSNGIDNKEYHCSIASFEEERVVCLLQSMKEDDFELPSKIYLFQGLPKADKMELIIQKAVELGAFEIIPVANKRCVVKLDEKKEKTKIARWQGIAEAAAKQSKRRIIPQIKEVMTYAQALEYALQMDVKLVPYELAENMMHTMAYTREIIENITTEQKIAVFIGPEGGFEEAEIQQAIKAGIEPITLGKRILRTETAGLTILSWLMYQLETKFNP